MTGRTRPRSRDRTAIPLSSAQARTLIAMCRLWLVDYDGPDEKSLLRRQVHPEMLRKLIPRLRDLVVGRPAATPAWEHDLPSSNATQRRKGDAT